MVWPSIARQSDFDRVVESHSLAAADVDAVPLPVGAAWHRAFKTTPELPLYSSDNFHPTELGSFLAAWVIFKQLYRDQTTPMPHQVKVNSKSIGKIELNQTQVIVLSKATDAILRE